MTKEEDEVEIVDKNNYDAISEEKDVDSEEIIMDKKEKDNFLDSLYVETHNVGNNNIVNISIENESKKLNDEKNSDEEDINISKSYISNINEKNIDEIVMERGEFNIFL